MVSAMRTSTVKICCNVFKSAWKKNMSKQSLSNRLFCLTYAIEKLQTWSITDFNIKNIDWEKAVQLNLKPQKKCNEHSMEPYNIFEREISCANTYFGRFDNTPNTTVQRNARHKRPDKFFLFFFCTLSLMMVFLFCLPTKWMFGGFFSLMPKRPECELEIRRFCLDKPATSAHCAEDRQWRALEVEWKFFFVFFFSC